MIADMHCHTRISDNSFTIAEVIAIAKRQGVTHLAITDHDTTAGLEEAAALGAEHDVVIIPGIEITAYDYKRQVKAHILGYFVESGHFAIEELCKPVRERRHEASYVMVKKLIEMGYDLTWEEVKRYASGGTGVYKQHIMHALIDKGYCSDIYSPLYKKLFNSGENDSPAGGAYVPIEYVDAADAIRTIRSAGGVPVLAHPGQFGNFEAVLEWVEIGLEGIEVKHPLHSRDDEERAEALGQLYGLVCTGGSDFHGFYGHASHMLGGWNPGIACVDRLRDRKATIMHSNR